MTALSLRSRHLSSLFDRDGFVRTSEVMPHHLDDDPCGGERVIDFALCLVMAVAIVGLLLLAL